MRFLDAYPLPERFKEAWRTEFDFRTGSLDRLAHLLGWVRHRQGGINPEESPLDLIRKARRELVVWFLKTIHARDAKAKMRKLLYALEQTDGSSVPSPPIKRIALKVHFELVRSGRRDITKKVLWDEVETWCKLLGLPVPRNRARILAEIGLADLPQAQSGRPRKKRIGIKRGP